MKSPPLPLPVAVEQRRWRQWIAVVILSTVLAASLTLRLGVSSDSLMITRYSLSDDPQRRAVQLLEQTPIIDGHIDLAILSRYVYANELDQFDLATRDQTRGEVDIPRLRTGHVGGFFWSVFVPCPEFNDDHSNFTRPSFRVRDTLEQIDVARLLIDQYSDTFQLVNSATEWRRAIRRGKIAGMLGVEGAHQLGSSLAALRIYRELGVGYVTLTHACHNALADSCQPAKPRWNGLSPFGRVAVREMNRIGLAVDVSHVSPETASDALSHSLAPVIFSHSNARGVHPVERNVPDSILRRIGTLDDSCHHRPRVVVNLTLDGERGLGWGNDTGEVEKPIPGGDALVMLNFAPDFVSEFPDGTGLRANVSLVADHADYIGRLAGRAHVGIGSDFDGILSTPQGLEDVSKYPNLIAELVSRGWSDREIHGLAQGNLLRVLEKVEATSSRLAHEKPSMAVFPGRTDLVPHPDGF